MHTGYVRPNMLSPILEPFTKFGFEIRVGQALVSKKIIMKVLVSVSALMMVLIMCLDSD